jgi:non-ribosomal peptide synthase protein (TIGR01720 family)
VGRADAQVKLHGYRIELGEIESTLAAHPGVSECLVVARDDRDDEKRLAAYFVTDMEEAPTADELRRHLKQRLPDYMIPSSFARIAEIPLTPSGKVDLRALPAPESSSPDADAVYLAPRSDAERALSAIWAELLGVEKVGIDDNFFQLGGDSITAIQVTARARREGLYFEVKDMFEAPTVGALAARVSVKTQTAEPSAAQSELGGEVPLTPIQHMFLAQPWPARHHYNQAILLRCLRRLDGEHLAQAVEGLVSHHNTLQMLYLRRADGSWAQEYHAPVDQPDGDCELLDLSEVCDAELGNAIEEAATDVQKSLDPERGRLFRAALIECGEHRAQRLLLAAHHLVVDDVSWRILLEDLAVSYRRLENGEPLRFPDRTSSYRDWSLALREYARQAEVRDELDYWLAAANGAKRVLSPQQSAEQTEGTSVEFQLRLSHEETAKLVEKTREAYGMQPVEVLLAALALAAADVTGVPELSLMLERHGRAEVIAGIDSTRTCGWFTTVYPVRLILSEVCELGRCLKEVKEQLRRVPHEGIGYGVLCYLVEGDDGQRLREAGRPQLSFNYLGQHPRTQTDNALWIVERGGCGRSIGEENLRLYELEMNSEIIDGQLETRWGYSHRQFEAAQVRRLADIYQRRLKEVIEHCSSGEHYGYTPIDFPLAKIEQAQLDEVLSGRKDVEDVYPLSPMQLGFLFHSLYEAESSAYFVQMTFELDGPVDEAELRKAWETVAQRHAVMRTSFIWQGEKPLQCVQKRVAVPWESYDWSGMSTEEQEKQIEATLLADRERRFNLSIAPLFRLTCIRLASNRSFLIWSHHHILFDGWSLPLVLKDVETVYRQRTSGAPAGLPPGPKYREFIRWLESRDTAQAEQFWRGYLHGVSEPTRLAGRVDEGDTIRSDGGYETCSFSLSRAALQEVQRRYHTTLSAILGGTWAWLLSRYTRREDVIFGITVSGRSADLCGAENIVGLLINTVPLRVRLSPDDDVLSLLRHVQQQTIQLQEYAYVSLARIQHLCEPGRGGDLFDTLFVFENYPRQSPVAEDVRGFHFGAAGMLERTEYPLTINVMPDQDVVVEMTYNHQFFDGHMIETVTEQFHHLIDTITASLLETAK